MELIITRRITVLPHIITKYTIYLQGKSIRAKRCNQVVMAETNRLRGTMNPSGLYKLEAATTFHIYKVT